MQLREIAAQVGELPPLPSTSVRLLGVINDPTASIEEIVEVIRYDQALTTSVLKLCNSAYFGLSRQVTSLSDALVCLGTVKVLQLIMALHTNALLQAPQDGYGLESGILWRHSVAVALAATQFARQIRHPNVNMAFTAGLLHDIGKTVLGRSVAQEYARILSLVTEHHKAFVEAEREVLGFDHTEVGAMLAERWKLPERLVLAIRFHHEPSALDPADRLVDCVYLANCVCLMMGIGLGADGLNTRADAAVLRRYGLTEHDLEVVGFAVIEELHKVEKLFGEQPAGEPAAVAD
jgi:putative nucleotidyltransferase with HDIG domain